MNKLCLLLLGVLAIAAIAAAWEREEDASLTEDLASSRLVRSPEAEAKRRKKGRKAKKGRKGRRKGRKSKGKGRKSRKNSRRSKKNKGKGRKSRKNNRRTKKSKSRSTQRFGYGYGRTVSDTCFEKAVTIMRMWKDVISNFEKQKKRMVKQNTTGGNKSGKKGVFAPIALRLIEAGGGNKSALKCGGKTGNSGAKQLKNLTDTLNACQTNVQSVCGKFTQPNMTKLNTCATLATAFKKSAQKCLDKSIGTSKNTTAACSCWTDAAFNKTVQAAKDCKFSTEAKKIADQLKNCTKAFGKCRKYEDAAITSIAACNSDSTKLTKKAAELTKNIAAVAAAKKTVKALASGTSGRSARSTKLSTCKEVVTMSTTVTTMIINFPTSPSIAITATKISLSTSVTCTTAEKTSLKALETKYTAAETFLKSALAEVQAEIQLITGSTASSTAIAAAGVTTSKPSGRRQMIMKSMQQTA